MRETLEAYRANTRDIQRAMRLKDGHARVTEVVALKRERKELPTSIELIRQLEQLPLTDAEREVLKLYYLTDAPSWAEVADRLYLSEPRIYQLRRTALEKLDFLDSQEKTG